MRESDVTEPRIAALAGRQGGVIGIAQLLDAGLDHKAVARRVEAGRLHPLHRGVYAVGHRHLGVTGRRWGAVLACGPGAALSHASAGAAWGILRAGGDLDVLVRLGGRTAPRGIRLHRTRILAPEDVVRLDELPITTPARTLLDLAALLTAKRLSTAISRAEQQRLLDFADLHRLLARHPRRPGSPALRAALARYAGPRDTRSALEDLVAELDLEPPQHNVLVEGAVRDFAWPRHRLVVEADSYTWHRSPAALDGDRERDVTLALAGWRTLRFTHAQITRRPRYVTAAINAALR
jgi:hypothetical protein